MVNLINIYIKEYEGKKLEEGILFNSKEDLIFHELEESAEKYKLISKDDWNNQFLFKINGIDLKVKSYRRELKNQKNLQKFVHKYLRVLELRSDDLETKIPENLELLLKSYKFRGLFY